LTRITQKTKKKKKKEKKRGKGALERQQQSNVSSNSRSSTKENSNCILDQVWVHSSELLQSLRLTNHWDHTHPHNSKLMTQWNKQRSSSPPPPDSLFAPFSHAASHTIGLWLFESDSSTLRPGTACLHCTDTIQSDRHATPRSITDESKRSNSWRSREETHDPNNNINGSFAEYRPVTLIKCANEEEAAAETAAAEEEKKTEKKRRRRMRRIFSRRFNTRKGGREEVALGKRTEGTDRGRTGTPMPLSIYLEKVIVGPAKSTSNIT
jgi:hypothetical protein